jgi:hypothetical protein
MTPSPPARERERERERERVLFQTLFQEKIRDMRPNKVV